MARTEGPSCWSRGGRVLGSAVLACGLLGACAGGGPSAPTAPAPTPTPAALLPQPTPGGFLHVLQGSVVVTHAIEGASGRLQESVAQRVGEAFALTGEPQGRFVFTAYDGRYSPPRDASVVAYAPDPSTGSLVTLSEATVSSGVEWYWLSASSTRVYGMAFRYTGHTYPSLVTFAVGSDGRVGPGSSRSFERDGDPWVALDADALPDVFYNSTPTGGLAAHFVEPDGGLKQMGGSHLCLASGMDHPRPLVAARGFLFASALLPAPSRETVCSWAGPRLAPRANLGLQAHRAG